MKKPLPLYQRRRLFLVLTLSVKTWLYSFPIHPVRPPGRSDLSFQDPEVLEGPVAILSSRQDRGGTLP
jgi:hypothetical protein